MSVDMLTVCGIVAGILSVFAFLPYIIDTLKFRTRPSRSTWMIWSVLASISFFSQLAEGATDSLWFAGVQTGGTIIIFLLSLHYGVGSLLDRFDFLVIICSVIGLWLWYTTHNAVYALAISITISILGGLLTLIKAYRWPGSETNFTWVVSFVAAIFAIISIGKVDVVMLAYPVYLFVLYGAIIVAIRMGRLRQEAARLKQKSEAAKHHNILVRKPGVV